VADAEIERIVEETSLGPKPVYRGILKRQLLLKAVFFTCIGIYRRNPWERGNCVL